MKKFYEKNEMWFALTFIIIYCVSQSFAGSVSGLIGTEYSANAIFSVILTAALLGFIFKNKLCGKYKLKKPDFPASKFLWYIPLVILVSENLWNGVGINFEPAALVFYTINMFCVGIIEEILFRGLLFEAIAKDNLKQAIVISSVTFGLGHIINIINGISTDILETLCQMGYAVALGFLFVLIYHRGGSIIPCILAHSGIDIASAFSNSENMSTETHTIQVLIFLAVILVYTAVLLKTLPKKQEHSAA